MRKLHCQAQRRTYMEKWTENGPVRIELGFRRCSSTATRKVKGQPDLCASCRAQQGTGNPNIRYPEPKA